MKRPKKPCEVCGEPISAQGLPNHLLVHRRAEAKRAPERERRQPVTKQVVSDEVSLIVTLPRKLVEDIVLSKISKL